MFDRWVAAHLRERVARPFVHFVFGAQQTGKSTLIRSLLPADALVNILADTPRGAGEGLGRVPAFPAAGRGGVRPDRELLGDRPADRPVHAHRHLLTFLDANRKKSRRAFIICRGRRPMQLHDRVTVIPWHCLCEGRIGDRRPTSTHAGAVEALPPEAVSGSDSSLGPRTTPNQSCHPTKSLLRRVGNDLTAPQTFGDTVDQRMSGGLLMPTMSKTIVEIRDAEAHFAKLTPLIRAGNVITLCDDNRPLAEIHPLPRPSTARRPFGLGRGTFTVPVDFAKGDQDIERMFCGELT